MTVLVVTAIFGGYEPIRPLPPGARGICFTDARAHASGWEFRRLRRDLSPRLKNRYVKAQVHQLVHDADVVLYVDGSFKLTADPTSWALEVLGDADFAAYPHPQRDCVYAEAEACIRARRGNPDAISAQVERYRAAGLPSSSGLYGGGILIRRLTARVAAFGEAWWGEIKRCERDQLSLGFLAWKMGQPIRPITDGSLYRPPFALYRGHRARKA